MGSAIYIYLIHWNLFASNWNHETNCLVPFSDRFITRIHSVLSISVVFHHNVTTVSSHLHHCLITTSPLSHQNVTTVSLQLHTVSLQPHNCLIITSPLSHHNFTTVSSPLCPCLNTTSPLSHHRFIQIHHLKPSLFWFMHFDLFASHRFLQNLWFNLF